MGFDPISWAMIASAAVGAGTAIYGATRKSPGAPAPGAPPAPVEGGPETLAKKRKAYRPASQLFRDEDLRLGAAGKLGL